MKLDKKLKEEQKAKLLFELFNLHYSDVGVHEKGIEYVLFDQDGKEFYDIKGNEKWEFSTLRDFFKYAEYLGECKGRSSLKNEIRNLLK